MIPLFGQHEQNRRVCNCFRRWLSMQCEKLVLRLLLMFTAGTRTPHTLIIVTVDWVWRLYQVLVNFSIIKESGTLYYQLISQGGNRRMRQRTGLQVERLNLHLGHDSYQNSSHQARLFPVQSYSVAYVLNAIYFISTIFRPPPPSYRTLADSTTFSITTRLNTADYSGNMYHPLGVSGNKYFSI